MIGDINWWRTTPLWGSRGVTDSILCLLEREEISRSKALELLMFAFHPRRFVGYESMKPPEAPWNALWW